MIHLVHIIIVIQKENLFVHMFLLLLFALAGNLTKPFMLNKSLWNGKILCWRGRKHGLYDFFFLLAYDTWLEINLTNYYVMYNWKISSHVKYGTNICIAVN